jgi:hypothetical protein
MPNKALVLVAAAVLEAREKPSTYSSRRPGRHVRFQPNVVLVRPDPEGQRLATS